MSNTEVEFYRKVRKDLLEDIAPHAFTTVNGPGARFLIVLEDMAERGYSTLSELDRCTPEYARAVITALANLHALFWESSRFAADLSWVNLASQRPGRRFRRAFDRYARQRVMSADYAKEFPPEVLRVAHRFGEYPEEMDRLAECAPLTLVHGAVQLGNTWTTREGKAGLYAWQQIQRRHGIQDVAGFLVRSFPTSKRRECERPLVEHYVQTLRAGGVQDVSVEDVWERYRLSVAYEWDSVANDVAFAGMQPLTAFERVNNAIVDLVADEAVERAFASL
jgi:Ecdysteroid kinase-like family